MQNFVSDNDIYTRVAEIVSALNVKPVEIARNVGISKSYMSMVLNRKTKIGLDMLVGLHQVYGVNVNWLLSGVGEMFSTLNNNTTIHEPQKIYNVSSEVLILQARLEECRETVLRLSGNANVTVLTKQTEKVVL